MATAAGTAISDGRLVTGPSTLPPSVASIVEDAYAAYEPEIRGYVASRFGCRVAAEDVVQEAFARLVRETRAGRAPDAIRPWLYRVAHNLAVSELRRPAWEPVEPVEPDAPARPEPRSPSAEVEFERWELAPELRDALATLPPPARLSLLMAADGYSGREIASATGRSELAVRALLCRTRRALRELLGGVVVATAEPELAA